MKRMTAISPSEAPAKRIVTISVDEDQVRDIDEIAVIRRSSRSQIMRDAIDAYIDSNGGPLRQKRIADTAVPA